MAKAFWPRIFPVELKGNLMRHLNSLLLASLALILSSCEVIGDIFGAGFYTGIFVVIFVIVLIVFIIWKFLRR